nr:reverse transcriptase domain-containing protein [Tanacetum cinerariifolium]
MEELCQPTLNGRGGPIASIAIQATNFGLKNDMIKPVQNSCPFCGPGDDANKHLDKLLHVAQSMKVNGVSDDALRLYLFPYSLQHRAAEWFDRLPSNSITTFEQMAKIFLRKYFPPSMVTKLRNAIMNFCQEPDESLFKAREHYKLSIDRCPYHNMLPDCPAIVGQTQNVYAARAYNQGASSSGSGTLPSNTITNPNEDLKGITTRSGTAYQGPTILTTSSSRPKVVECETKANDQKEKFFQIFQDLNFNISFADALILMPKFGPTIKSLLTNKEKLFELARTPLNEHCLAVLLNKLPEKLRDLGKFLIPCDFPGIDECLDLADLGASINLMPLSVWEMLSLPELSPTSVTFNLDQTSRYSSNYDDNSVNRIDVIDVAYEEYSQEVLGFPVSGNPTPSMELIVLTSSPSHNPFGDSDFLFEEIDAFLAIEDEPISPKIDDSYYDSEGDILLLEKFLNDDPSSPPLPL